jgi:hypothetical protein
MDGFAIIILNTFILTIMISLMFIQTKFTLLIFNNLTVVSFAIII